MRRRPSWGANGMSAPNCHVRGSLIEFACGFIFGGLTKGISPALTLCPSLINYITEGLCNGAPADFAVWKRLSLLVPAATFWPLLETWLEAAEFVCVCVCVWVGRACAPAWERRVLPRVCVHSRGGDTQMPPCLSVCVSGDLGLLSGSRGVNRKGWSPSDHFLCQTRKPASVHPSVSGTDWWSRVRRQPLRQRPAEVVDASISLFSTPNIQRGERPHAV